MIDGCMVGVKSAKNGKPTKKPWTFATDSEELMKSARTKRCDHEPGEHEKCEGSETTKTGFYPTELASMIITAFRKEDIRKRVEEARRILDSETAHTMTEPWAKAATREETGFSRTAQK